MDRISSPLSLRFSRRVVRLVGSKQHRHVIRSMPTLQFIFTVAGSCHHNIFTLFLFGLYIFLQAAESELFWIWIWRCVFILFYFT